MNQRNSSAYQNHIILFKKLFKSAQILFKGLSTSCPLMLEDQFSILELWINQKGIKNIINSLCIDVEMHDRIKAKSQDLEEYKPMAHDIKSEINDIEVENSKSLSQKNQSKIASEMEIESKNNIESSYSSEYSNQDQNSANKKSYKRGPYKNYTIDQKEQAVKMLLQDHCSVIQISRKLQIPCKNIKRWSQQGVFRKKGGGRKRFSPQTQRAVANQLKSHYLQGSEIPYEQVQNIARLLSEDQNFKASRGWVVKFVDRQHLRNYYKFI